jgi:magnesium chelatase family protein
MLARTKTSAVAGIDGCSVDVEVTVRDGQPRFVIIGLGDSAVRESRDRVLSALKQSGFSIPDQILVNLAPAELKKEGASFDLPMAVGILVASRQIKVEKLAARAFYGELSLDGRIKPVRGMVALAIDARRAGIMELVVPAQNYHEASLIYGPRIVAVKSLSELVRYLEGRIEIEMPSIDAPVAKGTRLHISDVWGQESAKRALLIAAAGGHNVLMIGPPGCGKSMLAERFQSLLPALDESSMLEAVRIHSIAGLPIESILAGEPPYRAPHHVVSDAGLIGGGGHPRPGEISLAHRGVLFLDEFPEFRRSALEGLRAPLESGQVRISRAKSSLVFPARFQLIAAMNPCPCGRAGVPGVRCGCSRGAIQGYLKKLSQPILDRIDLHVDLEAVPLTLLVERGTNSSSTTTSCDFRERVAAARWRQLEREGCLNGELAGVKVSAAKSIRPQAVRLLERAAAKANLSARGYIRIMRVAITIADLATSEEVIEEHVAEALSYRSLERLHRYSGLSVA